MHKFDPRWKAISEILWTEMINSTYRPEIYWLHTHEKVKFYA